MDTSHSSSSTISESSKQLLIATCSIGGTILLAYIFYVVYRVRQGVAIADVLKLRRRSSTHTANYGDYPIRFEQRYSVRSSRHPSRLDLLLHPGRGQNGGRRTGPPPLPLPVTQRFNSRDAYYRHYWKERAHPGTPKNVIESYFMETASPTPPKKPETVLVKERSRESMAGNSARLSARMSMAPTVSVRDLSVAEAEPPTPTSSRDMYTRWSWTNSEAPSTPRLNVDKNDSGVSTTWDATLHPKHNPHMSPIDENAPIKMDGSLTAKQSLRAPKRTRSVLVKKMPA